MLCPRQLLVSTGRRSISLLGNGAVPAVWRPHRTRECTRGPTVAGDTARYGSHEIQVPRGDRVRRRTRAGLGAIAGRARSRARPEPGGGSTIRASRAVARSGATGGWARSHLCRCAAHRAMAPTGLDPPGSRPRALAWRCSSDWRKQPAGRPARPRRRGVLIPPSGVNPPGVGAERWRWRFVSAWQTQAAARPQRSGRRQPRQALPAPRRRRHHGPAPVASPLRHGMATKPIDAAL